MSESDTEAPIPLSVLCACEELVFTSGKVGFADDGSIPADFETQARNALQAFAEEPHCGRRVDVDSLEDQLYSATAGNNFEHMYKDLRRLFEPVACLRV